MVAAAFSAIIKVLCGDGTTINYPCTVSDVNAEYYVFKDGNNDVVLPTTHGVLTIFDILLSAAGTDTSQAEIWVNAKNTGEVIMNAANITTAVQRQFTGSPIHVAPGARLRLKQVT